MVEPAVADLFGFFFKDWSATLEKTAIFDPGAMKTVTKDNIDLILLALKQDTVLTQEERTKLLGAFTELTFADFARRLYDMLDSEDNGDGD